MALLLHLERIVLIDELHRLVLPLLRLLAQFRAIIIRLFAFIILIGGRL